MTEKRRDRRLPIAMKLEISSLFKQDHVSIPNLDAPIHVANISKGGIGFTSSNDLPLDYYFNACIEMGQKDAKLYCVVKIIRKNRSEGSDETFYGCELVGVAPVLSYIFDDYARQFEE